MYSLIVGSEFASIEKSWSKFATNEFWEAKTVLCRVLLQMKIRIHPWKGQEILTITANIFTPHLQVGHLKLSIKSWRTVFHIDQPYTAYAFKDSR